jgi:hypothetical protein
VLLVAALLASGPGEATEQVGSSFGAEDPAVVRCELLMKMHERAPTGTERQFYDWAQGYYAGRSAGLQGAARRALPASGEARQQGFRKMLAFCAKNPAADFQAAVLALWDSGS